MWRWNITRYKLVTTSNYGVACLVDRLSSLGIFLGFVVVFLYFYFSYCVGFDHVLVFCFVEVNDHDFAIYFENDVIFCLAPSSIFSGRRRNRAKCVSPLFRIKMFDFNCWLVNLYCFYLLPFVMCCALAQGFAVCTIMQISKLQNVMWRTVNWDPGPRLKGRECVIYLHQLETRVRNNTSPVCRIYLV